VDACALAAYGAAAHIHARNATFPARVVLPRVPAMTRLLTFPDSQHQVLSIRAKALVFDDPASRALLAHA
jgi:hypothetical protein